MADVTGELGQAIRAPKTRRLGEPNQTASEARISLENDGLSGPFCRFDPVEALSMEEARNEFARRSRLARHQRVDLFGSTIARDLPWDILLLLYVHHESARLMVSSICTDVGRPPTTVLRWLKHLDAKGFIVREQHPSDLRIAFVKLTPAGKFTLDLYFEAMVSLNVETI